MSEWDPKELDAMWDGPDGLIALMQRAWQQDFERRNRVINPYNTLFEVHDPEPRGFNDRADGWDEARCRPTGGYDSSEHGT